MGRQYIVTKPKRFDWLSSKINVNEKVVCSEIHWRTTTSCFKLVDLLETIQDSCKQVVQLECKLTKIRHFLNLKFGQIVKVKTRCRREELWRSQYWLVIGIIESLFEVISRTNCAEETSRRKYIPTDQLRIVITNDRTIVLL